MRTAPHLLAAAALALVVTTGSHAASAEAPYDRQLIRLAEVLGSLHFLRPLCGEENSGWRRQMEALLEAEQPSPERRAKLVASFNHGYRSFATIYSSCTDSAVEAIERYMKEGEALASEIVLRFGN